MTNRPAHCSSPLPVTDPIFNSVFLSLSLSASPVDSPQPLEVNRGRPTATLATCGNPPRDSLCPRIVEGLSSGVV